MKRLGDVGEVESAGVGRGKFFEKFFSFLVLEFLGKF